MSSGSDEHRLALTEGVLRALGSGPRALGAARDLIGDADADEKTCQTELRRERERLLEVVAQAEPASEPTPPVPAPAAPAAQPFKGSVAAPDPASAPSAVGAPEASGTSQPTPAQPGTQTDGQPQSQGKGWVKRGEGGGGAPSLRVRGLQTRLNEVMPDAEPLRDDGEFGPKTQEALKQFQRTHGLPQTGVLDGRTLEAVRVPPPLPALEMNRQIARAIQSGEAEVGFSDRGPAVGDLQGKLMKLGYDAADVGEHGEAVFGRRTQAAVRRLQRENGMVPTGNADVQTMAVLQRHALAADQPKPKAVKEPRRRPIKRAQRGKSKVLEATVTGNAMVGGHVSGTPTPWGGANPVYATPSQVASVLAQKAAAILAIPDEELPDVLRMLSGPLEQSLGLAESDFLERLHRRGRGGRWVDMPHMTGAKNNPYEGKPKHAAAYERGRKEGAAYTGVGEARKLPGHISPGSSAAKAFNHGWEDGSQPRLAGPSSGARNDGTTWATFSDGGWSPDLQITYDKAGKPIMWGHDDQGLVQSKTEGAQEMHDKAMAAMKAGTVTREEGTFYTPKSGARNAPSGSLEGPFTYPSGWKGRYDPKEGRYLGMDDIYMPRDFDPHAPAKKRRRLEEAEMHDELAEVSSSALPDLPNKPDKTNWVENTGGLPSYIKRIAKHLHSERGKTVSQSIAIAVGTVRRWCAGGSVSARGGASTSNVSAKTKAQACAAIAQWEAQKKASKAKTAAKKVSESEWPETFEEALALFELAYKPIPPSLNFCAKILEEVEMAYDDWGEWEDGLPPATELREGALSTKERSSLPASAFVFPEDRRYPIHDEGHARNALARVSQHGTPAEQAKVRAAVRARYPKIGISEAAEWANQLSEADLKTEPFFRVTDGVPTLYVARQPVAEFATAEEARLAEAAAKRFSTRMKGHGSREVARKSVERLGANFDAGVSEHSKADRQVAALVKKRFAGKGAAPRTLQADAAAGGSRLREAAEALLADALEEGIIGRAGHALVKFDERKHRRSRTGEWTNMGLSGTFKDKGGKEFTVKPPNAPEGLSGTFKDRGGKEYAVQPPGGRVGKVGTKVGTPIPSPDPPGGRLGSTGARNQPAGERTPAARPGSGAVPDVGGLKYDYVGPGAPGASGAHRVFGTNSGGNRINRSFKSQAEARAFMHEEGEAEPSRRREQEAERRHEEGGEGSAASKALLDTAKPSKPKASGARNAPTDEWPEGPHHEMQPHERVASAASTAYMADEYGPAAFKRMAKFLLDQGHSEHEAEAILKSKHPRWAGDQQGKTNSAAFKRYYGNAKLSDSGGDWKAEGRKMAAETYSEIDPPPRARKHLTEALRSLSFELAPADDGAFGGGLEEASAGHWLERLHRRGRGGRWIDMPHDPRTEPRAIIQDRHGHRLGRMKAVYQDDRGARNESVDGHLSGTGFSVKVGSGGKRSWTRLEKTKWPTQITERGTGSYDVYAMGVSRQAGSFAEARKVADDLEAGKGPYALQTSGSLLSALHNEMPDGKFGAAADMAGAQPGGGYRGVGSVELEREQVPQLKGALEKLSNSGDVRVSAPAKRALDAMADQDRLLGGSSARADLDPDTRAFADRLEGKGGARNGRVVSGEGLDIGRWYQPDTPGDDPFQVTGETDRVWRTTSGNIEKHDAVFFTELDPPSSGARSPGTDDWASSTYRMLVGKNGTQRNKLLRTYSPAELDTLIAHAQTQPKLPHSTTNAIARDAARERDKRGGARSPGTGGGGDDLAVDMAIGGVLASFPGLTDWNLDKKDDGWELTVELGKDKHKIRIGADGTVEEMKAGKPTTAKLTGPQGGSTSVKAAVETYHLTGDEEKPFHMDPGQVFKGKDGSYYRKVGNTKMQGKTGPLAAVEIENLATGDKKVSPAFAVSSYYELAEPGDGLPHQPPPAQTEDALFGDLKKSVGGAPPKQPSATSLAVAGSGTGRGPSGKLRNFKVMGDTKFKNTYFAVADDEKDDPLAMAAVQAEWQRRYGKHGPVAESANASLQRVVSTALELREATGTARARLEARLRVLEGRLDADDRHSYEAVVRSTVDRTASRPTRVRVRRALGAR